MGGSCGAYGEERRLHRFLVENRRERDHWGDTDADGTTILRWIFRKWKGIVRTGWSWLRVGTGGGLF